MLSEFGGIAQSDDCDGKFWGYSMAPDRDSLASRYTALLEIVRQLPVLAGFCYTQFTDTYQEANGLLRADRTPKFPLERIADATRGPRTSRHLPDESDRPAVARGAGSQHGETAP